MNKKVMVVDDNRMNLRLLKEILEDEGFIVECVNESQNVLEQARMYKPDIILLDIMMPIMDGFQVCDQLKQDSELMDIPVIMITAKVEGTDVKKALELGAFDYIRKPVDETDVVARIHSALKYKEAFDRLKEMATKDGLTGVYNHSLLLDLFQKEAAKCERTKKTAAFVMIDIDYFKKVNDSYGHQTGDIVLKELVELINQCVRVSDIIGRYGGEEFSIVLSEVEEKDVYEICERIRASVEAYNFNIGNNNIKITVSIGISFKMYGDNLNSGQIVKKADDALYLAKKYGRNRVEVYK